MASLNSVHLIGNLCNDPEVRYTPKGTAVGGFNLAINESFKKEDGTYRDEVTFLEVEVWGRQAETCKQYLTKGSPVFIEGRLKLEQWEKDGKKCSKLKVRADRVQFLSNGKRNEDGPPAPQD